MILEDGAGQGYKQKVNGNFRAYTNAVVTSEDEQATKKGRSYNLNTGIIDLTSAADTPVMYFKNNEDDAFHITALAIGLGPSTGGTGGIPKITIVRNPTAGTTISNANDVDVNSNRNFGSSETLASSLVYKGATGETMTDGTDHIIFYQTVNGRLFATIDEYIPKGTSIGIKIDPQASNTSMEVYCAIIGHLEDPND